MQWHGINSLLLSSLLLLIALLLDKQTTMRYAKFVN